MHNEDGEGVLEGVFRSGGEGNIVEYTKVFVPIDS